MSIPQQLSMFEPLQLGQELGTFKDSMRAPIHGWFKYPAGFSYRFVEMLFDEFSVQPGSWVYDPFSGTGTTLVCAKQQGINAYGVEAHSFVHWVSQIKLYWEYNLSSLGREVEHHLTALQGYIRSNMHLKVDGVFPELVYKCYHPTDLHTLFLIREYLNQAESLPLIELCKLALTDTLRTSAAAGTGWPYIAPNKNTGDKPPKDALKLFQSRIRGMVKDIQIVVRSVPPGEIFSVLGDSRQKQDLLADNQVELALTSPPYLNNYDYADRTRLETYFWGIANSWGEITQMFRNKLMVAATTQIVRSEYDLENTLNPELATIAPEVYEFLQEAVSTLSQRRLTKGGKKDYDLMVALYFNDILKVVRETYRILKPYGKFCLVLGDSAPYGVHIPTESLIGKLGLAIGFSDFEYRRFRSRGGKWKDNPQRHTVELQEGVVILTK
ncbi:MAG: DNA modification methyltransferase [Chloroflexota bacterium]|nr:MAG: DNA modification methyltransferase [Chloroflexota bacterium]